MRKLLLGCFVLSLASLGLAQAGRGPAANPEAGPHLASQSAADVLRDVAVAVLDLPDELDRLRLSAPQRRSKACSDPFAGPKRAADPEAIEFNQNILGQRQRREQESQQKRGEEPCPGHRRGV